MVLLVASSFLTSRFMCLVVESPGPERLSRLQGYIDLSKRRVSAEDVKKCEEKFAKGKIVNSILRHVAELKDLVWRSKSRGVLSLHYVGS
jgi:hypothetical protein